MKSNLTLADWLGQLVAIAALAGIMLNMQARTDNRLDRIEDRIHSGFDEMRIELRKLGERVARLEALAEIRPAADAPAATSD